jgi:nucleotide-binding universal stress UspA family protein
MSYASILVHAETNSTSSDARLELGCELARRFHAVLIGLAAEGVRPPLVDAFGGAVMAGEMLVADEERIRAELEAAEKAFRSHPRVRGLSVEWRSAVDLPALVLAQESRAADLIVMGRNLERLAAGVYQTPDPGDVIMTAGRPVLVVPPGARSLIARHVLVAWKDTREARRAVWDASPFLRASEAVHVVEVADEADLEAATERISDVVRHLERHHVKARGEVRTRREASAADELMLVAEQHGADLIVAGAYGHARMREWVFGGVTHDLLTRCPKCCLLSH